MSKSLSSRKKRELEIIKENIGKDKGKKFESQELSTQEDVVEYINGLSLIDDNGEKIEINQTTMSRHKDILGIAKNNNLNRYMLKQNIELEETRSTLIPTIKENSINHLKNPGIFVINVKEGQAERVGMAIKKVFPEKITGFFNQRETILLVCKDEKAVRVNHHLK